MAEFNTPSQSLTDWLQIPHAIENAVEGMTDNDLDRRGGPYGWSIRETVHHLVEANLVATTAVIAAMGKSGCVYDWSWLNPDRSWIERMGYTTAAIGPGIETLSALGRYLESLFRASPDALRREVKLLDAPGADVYSMTVEQILQQEVVHANEHLQHVRDTLVL